MSVNGSGRVTQLVIEFGSSVQIVCKELVILVIVVVVVVGRNECTTEFFTVRGTVDDGVRLSNRVRVLCLFVEVLSADPNKFNASQCLKILN